MNTLPEVGVVEAVGDEDEGEVEGVAPAVLLRTLRSKSFVDLDVGRGSMPAELLNGEFFNDPDGGV